MTACYLTRCCCCCLPQPHCWRLSTLVPGASHNLIFLLSLHLLISLYFSLNNAISLWWCSGEMAVETFLPAICLGRFCAHSAGRAPQIPQTRNIAALHKFLRLFCLTAPYGRILSCWRMHLIQSTYSCQCGVMACSNIACVDMVFPLLLSFFFYYFSFFGAYSIFYDRSRAMFAWVC